jgi:hypothetical protein
MEAEDGLCKFTVEPPFQHTPETRLAWRIYKETVNLSGFDALNLPSIDKIEAVLAKWNLRMTRAEAASLIDVISAISSTIRSGLRAKQLNNG